MPLKDLLVSEKQMTEDALQRILGDSVRLSEETHRALLTPEGAELTARAKIIVVLAAQHAWRFIQPGEEQSVSLALAELATQTGLPGNTLRPALKALADKHIIESVARGSYQLPPHALTVAEKEVGEARQNAGRQG